MVVKIMQNIVIGTRGSKLALWQANLVEEKLRLALPLIKTEIKIIQTKGDEILDVALSKIGDKGLFTKEIEKELLDNTIDMAVHSLKDLPSLIEDGLEIGAILERENPQDVLLSHKRYTLKTLPKNAIIGTSSLRRVAQLKTLRPDLNIVDIRGNVETRIKKMKEQDMDGIILAYAGVKRLGFEAEISDYISVDKMLPAVGQGSIAIEIRSGNAEIKELLSNISDYNSAICIEAERAFLHRLEGGCQLPVAAYAVKKGNQIKLYGLVSSLDGQRVFKSTGIASVNRVIDLGISLADKLLAEGADIILEEIRGKEKNNE